MKKQLTRTNRSVVLPLIRATSIASLLPSLLLIFIPQMVHAGSATWNLHPASGDWNTAANWTPATVPNGPADLATLATSNQTNPSCTALTEVNGIIFNASASAFTVTASPTSTLTISGGGITNNSGITQNFVTTDDGAGNIGTIAFTNAATAGSLTAITNTGSMGFFRNGGATQFLDTSTAGNCTLTNNGGSIGFAFGGSTQFITSSTAGNGAFINNGGLVSDAFGGTTGFFNTSTAGAGTFTNNPATIALARSGGETYFEDTATADNGTFTNIGSSVGGGPGGSTLFAGYSTAGNATLIATGEVDGAGGAILFYDGSTGGTARVEVFGTGNLDISSHIFLSNVTIGSIEGSGAVFLGSFRLTIGSNNLGTTFSGTIQDGGKYGGTGGSLAKTGTGEVILSGANTYTGGTSIEGGQLVVNNTSGSGTGTGAVQVNEGTLGGRGTIAGTVTVGTGSGASAVLAPGRRGGKPGTPLTIQSTLTFNSDATYTCGLNTKGAIADKVVANGVTISGAQFLFVDRGRITLPSGTVFTVIDNTAATPIAGAFSNLDDGSILVARGNSFQANYEGGDGNDLTLMVVP